MFFKKRNQENLMIELQKNNLQILQMINSSRENLKIPIEERIKKAKQNYEKTIDMEADMIYNRLKNAKGRRLKEEKISILAYLQKSIQDDEFNAMFFENSGEKTHIELLLDALNNKFK